MKDYKISTSFEDMDLDLIYEFISNSYWAKKIPRETMDRAVKNSLSYGIFDENNNQVGFARLITDRATFAYLADVFILEEHRGKGLARFLIETILENKELQGLRRILLATKDAQELYKKFNFTPIPNPETLMHLFNPDVYKNKI